MPYVTQEKTVLVWIPGFYYDKVEKEGYWTRDASPGWNAGAHSLVWLQQPPPGYEGITARYTFKARKESLGIFVGLASDDAGTSPTDVLAGVYLSMGQWRPVRDGEKLSGGGAFTDGTLFALDLTPTGMYISTPDGGEFVPYVMPSAVCLDAALYLKDDEILSADFACGGGQLGVLAPLQGLASDGPIGHANSVLAPVTGRAGMHEGCAGVLAPLGGVAWTGAGLGAGVLAPMQSEGVGSVGEIGVAFHQAVLAPVDGVGVVRSGYSGQQYGGTLARLEGFSYGGFGGAASGQPFGVISPVTSYAFGVEGNHEATISSWALGRTPTAAQPRVRIAIDARGHAVASIDSKPIGALEGVESGAELKATIDAVLALGADLDSSATLTVEFNALFLQSVQVGSSGHAVSGLDVMLALAEMISSQAELTGSIDVGTLLNAALLSQAVGSGEIQCSADLVAYIDATVRAALGLTSRLRAGAGGSGGPHNNHDGGTADYDDGYYVWVLNARTNAVSRYLRYGFDSFAQIGGHYFGVAEDGVYLLEGNTDAGQRIEARVGTGLLDLGAKELKHVSAVYLDTASEGVLSVRVQAGEQQYTYQARRASQYNAQQRVDTGRGLRATHYSFELLNSGADFELDSMDVNATKSARRI